MLKLISIYMTLILLSACTTPADTALIELHTAKYLNPNAAGLPSPLVISIFELDKPNLFKQASYQTLTSRQSNDFTKSIIDKHSFEIRPSHSKEISLELSPDTKYLGIIANYRKVEKHNWRQIIKLSPSNHQSRIKLNLQSQQIKASIIKAKGLHL